MDPARIAAAAQFPPQRSAFGAGRNARHRQTIASPGWTDAELAPYLDVALEAFGPARLIFGSDWPVCTTAASYADVCAVAERACSGLSEHERTAVLAGNARAIYRAG